MKAVVEKWIESSREEDVKSVAAFFGPSGSTISVACGKVSLGHFSELSEPMNLWAAVDVWTDREVLLPLLIS